eukprot:7859708-Lingulodinium_polyedra.AAC.1
MPCYVVLRCAMYCDAMLCGIREFRWPFEFEFHWSQSRATQCYAMRCDARRGEAPRRRAVQRSAAQRSAAQRC